MSTNGTAVLSSALLARKGAAAPTGYAPHGAHDTAALRHAAKADFAARQPAPAGGTAARGRARISLRLDRERHLKLRLTAAHLQRSLQELVTEAVDRYLEQLGPEVLRTECGCLGVSRNVARRAGPSPSDPPR